MLTLKKTLSAAASVLVILTAGCSNLTKTESGSASAVPNGIILSSDSVILIKGETATVKASVSPAEASQSVVWELSGTNAADYATLTNNGDGSVTVTALKIGTVHLRADAAAVEKGSAQANCEIKITQIVPISFLDSMDTSVSVHSSVSYREGEEIISEPQPTVTKSGYTFSGWYSELKSGEVSGERIGFPYKVTSNTNAVYAKWEKNDTEYTVMFNSNGGSAVSAVKAYTGKMIEAPSQPSYSGKTFSGWYTDSGCTDAALVSFPYTVTKNITFYAKWVDEINVVSVSSVTISSTAVTVVEGKTVSLTAGVLPANATNKSIIWTTSNSSAASVSSGIVTAVSQGTAVITATSSDGGKTASCTVTVEKGTVPVTGVTLTPSAVSITKGATTKLSAQVNPANASNANVTWSSSNTAVAAVNSTGIVSGESIGTAAITVTTSDGSYKGTSLVTVTNEEIAVTGVSLSSNSETLKVNDTDTLTAVITPADATNKNVTWASSNPSVATVSNGVINALAKGSAVITVTTKDGSFISTCDVTVEEDTPFQYTDITLHAYNYCNAYVWNTTSSTLNKTHTTLTQEGTTNWYKGTFGVTSMSLIFTTVAGGWTNQTGDLALSAAGEYWYKNGTFTQYNPDGPQTPVVTASVKAGTYTEAQTVTLSSTNSDDIIYYTTNGTTPGSSSAKYSTAITISATSTLKAVGYNANAATQWGSVLSVAYVIDPDADLIAPTITPSKTPGRYETAISVTFTVTDNKTAAVTTYYTTDGSTVTVSSGKYTSGTTVAVAMDERKTINMLAIDAAGNETRGTYYYSVGTTPAATRFDPRQESIYFLLTARWFDGDSSNTIGDAWCSYHPDASSTDNSQFSGPSDVTWRGDFKGLVEKMDYIKALGFTCIWITPVVQNRGPLCYHGYHAWDMYHEDARLVSDGYDFQRVVDEAHNRGMKICLDVVLNHSGRFGLKDFAEIKYNRTTCTAQTFNTPSGWENFTYDETAYQTAAASDHSVTDTSRASVQNYPNGWYYDGLKSPGTVNGVAVGPYTDFAGDVRPFTSTDLSNYSYLNNYKYNWPTTESYKATLDGMEVPAVDHTYAQYCALPKLHFHGYATGFNDSSMFDIYPACNLRSIHEDCPDLNTESAEVQKYLIGAYKRYIDMGVDMFRVDTLMHIDKQTVNDVFWPAFFNEAATSAAKNARGGGDFFIFGEVANFVCNFNDKPAQLRQSNYTWDNTVTGPDSTTYSSNALLNGNEYRTPDYSHKAVPSSDYHVSTIDIVSHNNFCNGSSGGYGKALDTSGAYNDATYLTWYADCHDYGPNKGTTRYQGDFAGLWSMLFTFRGIPIVYYGSEIRFAAGKPNDWPGSTKNSLDATGRAYYGANLEGTVKATDFGTYTASGAVATTLASDLSKHLIALNKIRLAVPALQMGEYSTEGHSGGWAGYKRRYTGKNKITGESIDSYCLVGVGAGTHSWTGVLNGTYIDCVTGKSITVSGGSASFTVTAGTADSSDAALGVYVLTGLTTAAPGKIANDSPYFGGK